MKILKHKFVDKIPDILEDKVLYVSMEYETVIHKCACGCGNEIVTPLSPAEWSLTFNGETISLEPSIGSWSLDCKSHYWITNNRVKWSYKYSADAIEKVKKSDLEAKKDHFEKTNSNPKELENKRKERESLWKHIKSWANNFFSSK